MTGSGIRYWTDIWEPFDWSPKRFQCKWRRLKIRQKCRKDCTNPNKPQSQNAWKALEDNLSGWLQKLEKKGRKRSFRTLTEVKNTVEKIDVSDLQLRWEINPWTVTFKSRKARLFARKYNSKKLFTFWTQILWIDICLENKRNSIMVWATASGASWLMFIYNNC